MSCVPRGPLRAPEPSEGAWPPEGAVRDRRAIPEGRLWPPAGDVPDGADGFGDSLRPAQGVDGRGQSAQV